MKRTEFAKAAFSEGLPKSLLGVAVLLGGTTGLVVGMAELIAWVDQQSQLVQGLLTVPCGVVCLLGLVVVGLLYGAAEDFGDKKRESNKGAVN